MICGYNDFAKGMMIFVPVHIPAESWIYRECPQAVSHETGWRRIVTGINPKYFHITLQLLLPVDLILLH